jgi:hypothetical protein
MDYSLRDLQAAKFLAYIRPYSELCERLLASGTPQEWAPTFAEFCEHPDAANKYLKYCELLVTPAGGELIILLGGDKVGSFQNFLKVRSTILARLS